MQKAILYKTGDVEEAVEVQPQNGKTFTLEELQAFVAGPNEQRYGGRPSGTVEIIGLPDGRALVCNENGRILKPQLAYNEGATKVWREAFPIEQYPNNNLAYHGGVLGNVLVCPGRMIR